MKRKPPEEKLPRLRTRGERQPWNDANAKLELFISPDLKLRIKKLPPPKKAPEPAFMQEENDE